MVRATGRYTALICTLCYVTHLDDAHVYEEHLESNLAHGHDEVAGRAEDRGEEL